MRIGGFQPSSLVDFPGTVSAVVFTVGCNFRCPYCHNPELVLESPERLIPEEEVLARLASRRGVLPAVTVTGGEPTLQEDLLRFLRMLREIGLRIKLDTNGTSPAALKDAVAQGLVDYVAMDIKAPLSSYAQVVGSAVDVDAIRESVQFLVKGPVEYEFRTTIVRSQLSPEALRAIAQEIRGARRFFLQQFNPLKTLHPSFRSKVSYSRDELDALADELSPYVQHCAVRA